MIRIIYLGTPQFAVPTLAALIERSAAKKDVEVVAAVCQPDRPKGRGGKVEMPPVKVLAQSHNIPVLQPTSLARQPEYVEAIRGLKPDLIVMVAFGQILKKAMLEIPPMGIINVHGSLLPHLRGAAPINWAIINGDTKTGVTTMFTEAGVDTGPMLLKAEIAIGPEMNAVELAEAMSQIGAAVLIQTIDKLLDGTLVTQPQDDSQATLAPILSRELSRLDFTQSAQTIHNKVRGLTPWPSTIALFRDSELKIHKTRVSQFSGNAEPGLIVKDGGRVLIACGSASDRCEGKDVNWLELLEVQPPSKAKMAASAWINGVRPTAGEKLN